MSFNPSQQIRSHQTRSSAGMMRRRYTVSIPLNKSGLIKPTSLSRSPPQILCFNPSQQIRSHQTRRLWLSDNTQNWLVSIPLNKSGLIKLNSLIHPPPTTRSFNPSQQIRSHQTHGYRPNTQQRFTRFNPSQQIRSHQTNQENRIADLVREFQSLSTNQVSSNVAITNWSAINVLFQSLSTNQVSSNSRKIVLIGWEVKKLVSIPLNKSGLIKPSFLVLPQSAFQKFQSLSTNQVSSNTVEIVTYCKFSLNVSIPLNKSGLIKQTDGTLKVIKASQFQSLSTNQVSSNKILEGMVSAWARLVSIPLNKSGLIKHTTGNKGSGEERESFNPSQQIRSHQTAPASRGKYDK